MVLKRAAGAGCGYLWFLRCQEKDLFGIKDDRNRTCVHQAGRKRIFMVSGASILRIAGVGSCVLR